MRRWVVTPLPAQGSGGEQMDAAPGLLEPTRAKLLRNGIIIGPGSVEQVPDWLRADTCKNLAGTPVEGHAVCGIFPFAQQGGASSSSGGIAFSFNGDDDKVYLHHLDELGVIMRTLEAHAGFANALPPQITGFEMFGKFYWAPYRPDEGAGTRKGFSVYDPTGGGVITHPTFVLAGGAASVLKFRGISNHRGATIFGWGYQDEGVNDGPHVLRYCRYGTPDTWVPDTTDETAGFINVGTLQIPIVACGMSGQYTIVGKETEIFALDGDKSANFYYRRIGRVNGPVSTVGLVEIDQAAVWMSLNGPVVSTNGDPVQLLAIDRVMRRFLSYHDLTTCWGAHDADRHRVVWGMRRKTDDDGALVGSPYLTELFWWDYERHAFGAHGLPTPIFSVGIIRGAGLNVVGPTGLVSNIAASPVGSVSATITWTPGDAHSDVTFQVQRRVHGTSTYVDAGTSNPGQASLLITGLANLTLYDVRVRQVRNGVAGAYVEALSLFTTTASATPVDPTNPDLVNSGHAFDVFGIPYYRIDAYWDAFFADQTRVRCYVSTTSSLFEDAVLRGETDRHPEEGTLFVDFLPAGLTVYAWFRDEAIDDAGLVGNPVPANTFPFVT